MSRFDDEYKKRRMLFGNSPTEELVYVVEKYQISGVALELACGDGRDIAFMVNKGITVEAFDLSENAINTVNCRDDLIPFTNKFSCKQGDMINYNYSANSYDFIYGITAIDHIEKNYHIDLIEKLLGALKEGGYLLLKVHTIDDNGYTHKGKISEFASEIKHYFEINELINYFKMQTSEIVFFIKNIEDDFDHGEPHQHSYATILVKNRR